MPIEFTVYGNHLGKKKNPSPYHSAQPTAIREKVGMKPSKSGKRMVPNYKTKFMPNRDPQVLKYHEYCQHVRNALIEELRKMKGYSRLILTLSKGKRIQITKEIQTKVYQLNMIYFLNDNRGDAENVGKGIIDSIHKEDKYVEGYSPYTYDKENPRVEVFITCDINLFKKKIDWFFNKRMAEMKGE